MCIYIYIHITWISINGGIPNEWFIPTWIKINDFVVPSFMESLRPRPPRDTAPPGTESPPCLNQNSRLGMGQMWSFLVGKHGKSMGKHGKTWEKYWKVILMKMV